MPEPGAGASVPRIRELPCARLTKAVIDVAQHLVRYEYDDRRGRACSGLLRLEADDIRLLNRGGSVVLRDQSGGEIAIRV